MSLAPFSRVRRGSCLHLPQAAPGEKQASLAQLRWPDGPPFDSVAGLSGMPRLIGRSSAIASTSSLDRRNTPVLEDQSYFASPQNSTQGVYLMEHPVGSSDTAVNVSQRGDGAHYHPLQPTPQHAGSGDNDARFSRTPFGHNEANMSFRRVPFTPNDYPTNDSMLSGTVLNQQPMLTPRTTTHNNVIRVINKDMTAQFRGRAQSVPHSKIRWFENKKSQLLGCCIAMAFLGMTIAMYNYRWTGLIAGSVTTIICGSAVVVTYFRKKQWHQHPNPIVHNRAILGIFFAICLLLNIAVNFQPGNDKSRDNCRKLAGVTEFFFFTSEAWGLMMACDLFFSLTSPFTSYKYLMRFYHLWVWLGGIIMASIAWSVSEAGGFFTVDGQSIKYNGDRNLLVGFCLASSRVCCEDPKKCDEGLKQCENADFLNTQKWPWILIYSFVIVVLLVSVCVLMLAWHRLYLRGVPKTYNIRLRVLNYVSFFTGAYVFYWLLLLLMYMCAYFMSTRSMTKNGVSEGGSNEAIAQVLRQIVAFLISAKGYLDYVIWFAVNSIEHRTGDRSNRGQESADVDVDLSPQVNTALRSEILYYTTSGIKESVRAVSDELITIPISGEGEKSKFVKFWSFCPAAFRNIRLTYGISDAEYISMFGATTKEQFSEGRSGAFMFFTGDERLIVKTMSPEECNFLRKIAPSYEGYMTSNRNTLLTRFYGCHAVSLYGKMYYFVVMGNLFADTQVVHHRYDIKGSWVDRNAKVPKPGDKTTCRYCNASYTFGSTRNQECGDGLNFHEPNIVLKDNDLMMKIRIDARQAHKIYDQIHKDSDFLCDQGIMDYSLLMGVQSSEYFVDTSDFMTARNPSTMTKNGQDESLFTQVATSVSGPSLYHFGIIDILQQWTFEKKAERFYKVNFKRKDPDGVSAMPPKPYKFRFQQRMSRIFGLGSQTRANAPAYHLSHPALIDVLDQSDFATQRPGTFTSVDDMRPMQQNGLGGFVPVDQYSTVNGEQQEYRFA